LAPSSFIEPCLPTVTERAPSGPGWLHEIKHDGYRLQIHLSGGRVRLSLRRPGDRDLMATANSNEKATLAPVPGYGPGMF